jgi:phage baseplate assembly protein W
MMSLAAIVITGWMSASVAAQAPPDFSGQWTVEAAPATTTPPTPGAPPPRGDMGSGWGSPLTITQDARQLVVEQVLFTSPGERVNRADFGSGIMQMVFAPNSSEFAAALQFTVEAAIQRYLADVIDIQSLKVSAVDSTLSVDLDYIVRSTGQPASAQFSRQV